jgi:phosphoglycolate phosphatase
LVAATNAALAEVGRAPLGSATVLGFVGNGVRRLVAQSLAAAGGGRPRGATTSDRDFDRALAGFLSYYEEHLLDVTRPYEGIVDALDALGGGGALLSVLTNKPGPLARSLLSGLGLGDRFFAVVGGEEGLPPKPDASGAERIIARSGSTPGEMLLVGDSPVDVRTARAARVAACAVTWGFSPPGALRDASPDFLIEDPGALIR